MRIGDSSSFPAWNHYAANVRALQSMLGGAGGGRAGSAALQAMGDRLAAQARQAAAAASNAANAMDYQRTEDGWLQQVNNLAGRMGELAVMANDGTRSEVERSALQSEFGQMQQAIQGITSGPYALGKFNGLYLFQG